MEQERPAPYPIIDSHVHVQPWDELLPGPRAMMLQGKGDPQRLLRLLQQPAAMVEHLDAMNVRRAVLVNYPAPTLMGFTHRTNDFVAHYTKDHRDRFVRFGGVLPGECPDVAAEVDRCLSTLELEGLKIHPPHQELSANGYLGENPQLATIYEKAQEAGVPVMIHTGTSIFPGARNRFADPMAVDDVAVDFPRLRIILAHMGRPMYVETCRFLLRRHPNVFGDVSSIPPSRLLHYLPDLERLQDKLLFGTDWPAPMVQSIGGNVSQLLDLGLPDGTTKALLVGNAEHHFGW